MSRILIACLLLFAGLNVGFILPGSTRSSNLEVIHWENRPLTWNDFRAKPSTATSISALTASAIEYSYSCRGGELEMRVQAVFIPDNSWVKSDAKTDYILAHEQLHFDITELYARKLRRELSEKVSGCYEVKKIDAIAERMLKEWKKVQEAYDQDTHHSIDKEEQYQWIARVRDELYEYADYPSPDVR